MALSLVTVAPIKAGAEEYTFTAATDLAPQTEKNGNDYVDKVVIENPNGFVVIKDKVKVFDVGGGDDGDRPTIRYSKSKGTADAIETGKNGISGLEIEITGSDATIAASLTSTGGKNTSAFALLGPDDFDNIVREDNGTTTVYGTSPVTNVSWSHLTAGTYRLISNHGDDSSLKRGVQVRGLTITDTAASGGAAITKTYTFAATELGTLPKDKNEFAAGATFGTDGFFSASGKVVQRSVNATDLTAKSVEIEKDGLGSIDFTLTGTADVKVEIASTGGNNMSDFSLLCDGTAVASKDGDTITTVTGTKAEVFVNYSDLTAGDYKIISPDGTDNDRGVRIYSIEVVETTGGGGTKSENVKWDKTKIYTSAFGVTATKGAKETEVKVTVKGPFVGKKKISGADGVTYNYTYATDMDVELLKGTEVLAKQSVSSTNKDTNEVTFALTDSGTYGFKVTVKRGEQSFVETPDTTYAFVYPLGTPSIASATSMGGGSVTVKWGAVHEATSYKVYVNDVEKATTTDKTEATITGLPVGKEVSIVVSALRGTEEKKSDAVKVDVTETAQREWGFTYWGENPSKDNTGVRYIDDTDLNDEGGSVDVFCIRFNGSNNVGKFQMGKDNEGAFYYTPIPTSKNFRMKARIHVNKWTLSGGQEAMGMAVMDRVAEPGLKNTFWTNGFYAIATKARYKGQNTGMSYTQNIGWCAIEEYGITADNLADFENPDTSTAAVAANFKSNEGREWNLETWADDAGMMIENANVVGNSYDKNGNVDNLATSIPNPKTDIILEIRRNNDGYKATSWDAETGALMQERLFYGTDILDQIDSEYVYAGFFVARAADINVSDFSLELLDPADDDAAQVRPVTQVTPRAQFASASVANSTDYKLGISSNANGTANISLNGEEILFDVPISRLVRTDIPLTLIEGRNNISVTFYPGTDAEQEWEDEYTKLKNRNPSVFDVTVTFNNNYSHRTNLYVSPTGSGAGSGAIQSPMLLTRAIEVVQPGQTIVVMGGTYRFENTITIQRGINGTADAPIRMVAEPGTRPILDFQGLSQGLTVAGNYWYIQGLDFVHTSNNEEAMALCGSYNTIDRCRFYDNAGSGMQISRLSGSDSEADWPCYNLILNCDAYNNDDLRHEDADGFGAKLTCGPGNVFDGCIAHHNGDDGWDLFAKVQTGSVGPITIRNSIAYSNGFLPDRTNAGNGNGFKMGGDGIVSYRKPADFDKFTPMPDNADPAMKNTNHTLENSYAFFNKSKGIDSNSAPDNHVYNSVSWNNASANVAMYTKNNSQTNYDLKGIISMKDETADEILIPYLASSAKAPTAEGENLKPLGTQDKDQSALKNEYNYYYEKNAGEAVNSAGNKLTKDIFESTTFDPFTDEFERAEDGTIIMNGFLQIKEGANVPEGVAPTVNANGTLGTPSPKIVLAEEKPVEGAPTGNGGGAGGGAAGGTTTDTTPKPEATQKPAVTVVSTETVTADDGTVTTTITKSDGSKTEKVTTPEGEVIVTATDANGEVVATVDIPAVIPEPEAKFEDVPEGHWAEAAINEMAALGVVKGVGATDDGAIFDMTSNVTRATMAQILFNLSHGKEGKAENFPDVAEGAWYTDAVAWAADAGIVTGYNTGDFGPNDAISREQLAVMLYRYAGLLGMEIVTDRSNVLGGFADAANVSSWATEAVTWAVSAGIIQGTGAGLNPSASASRAETAVMFDRFVKLIVA